MKERLVHERHALLGGLAIVIVGLLTASHLVGQTPATAAKTSTTPRTPWGDPDLQGMWTPYGMVTPPMERPKAFGSRAFLTDEEVIQAEKSEKEEFMRSAAEGPGPRSPTEIQIAPAHEKGIYGAEYNNFWIERPRQPRKVWRRTSLVIDPPDGRIPPLTPEALERLATREHGRRGRGQADSWEDRNVNERCISTASSGLNAELDSNSAGSVKHILQVPQYVAIVQEMTGVYRSRVIPVDGRPRVSNNIRQWLGDSRGHWEGDTLVVETTNINGKQDGGPIMPSRRPFVFYLGSGETLRLVERFTRLDADTIEYHYTVDDPKTYLRPYTVAFPLTKDDSYRMLEVACHEGNYGMTNILTAARADERSAFDTAQIEARDRLLQFQEMKRKTADALQK